MERIDFVVLWVDGSDEKWLKEKEKYSPKRVGYNSAENRFREWDNLKYWFRGVEKYAPWVNSIYFITCGHYPEWLNKDHPKLKIVNHDDYIPTKYLPTFNSNVIELNLHRIKDLSENFVLFNDDTFIIYDTKPTTFFKKDKPRDEFVFNTILPIGEKGGIAYININNLNIINKYFIKNEVIKQNIKKIFNWRYGKNLIRTMLLMPWEVFVGFRNPHLPMSHKKSTFTKLWKIEKEALEETCNNKFRGKNDLNHWLMRYWNLCLGKFEPRKSSVGQYFNVSDNNKPILDYIKKQIGSMICINDMSTDFDFEKAKQEINEAFNTILTEKSKYEM